MKLVGMVMEFNESTRGNLVRCLDNMNRYCDELVVYDDASTDDSVEVATPWASEVIVGETNDFKNETTHRQQMLDLAMGKYKADFVFYLDADEILDREGTEGGLRKLCDDWVARDFPEITLWRSMLWQRKDYLGSVRFPRLWPVLKALKIPIGYGLHRQLYPSNLGPSKDGRHRVLHYGYATQEAIERRWRERTRLGVGKTFRRKGVDERKMRLTPVPREWFPPGVEVPESEPKPEPIRYSDDVMKEAGW
jgi:glycosyltransferase involved in cell wall biosynthesis